jgi:alkanesulfonate monooxygenase SsuD/methylene tetrahydromethanopterin reductase-like flavin-dependent oxidoreductase (luciferase family)
MLGGSGNGILRRAGTWADIIHMAPAIGGAGTTTIESVVAFSDATVPEKLARVREAEARAGRAPGSVRYASTIFSYSMTDSPAATQALAENLGRLFSLAPADVIRHPVVLIGTPEEMVTELRRRERTHGLSLVAVNFTNQDEIRRFGEKVLAVFR